MEEKCLNIFRLYNLCNAGYIGRLVEQEMLVALGEQKEIDWGKISSNTNELEDAKRRYEEVRKITLTLFS